MPSPASFTESPSRNFVAMFGWLKPKSQEEKLEALYKQKLQEAFELSKVNRAKADLKTAEAEALAQELEALRNASKSRP
jgi:hypothetical protein